ncbi:hypothetical protein GW915_05015 [bacterium]|nr:hypothetical protein [bacterium]
MFNFIRRYRNFFSIIFGLAAVGMVISLFGTGADVGGGGGLWNAGSAAKVMGERITINEFGQAFEYQLENARTAMERQFKGSKADAQTKAFLESLLKAQVSPQSVLNSLIQQRYMMALSKQHGFKVPAEAIRYLLAKNPAFQKDGKFDPLLYKQMVARPGEYENRVREQLFRDALFYNLSVPVALVSQAELEEAKLLKQDFVFELLEVKPSSVKAPSVSQKDVDDLLADSAADTELKGFYESHRNDYETQAKVHARHILINEAGGGKKKAEEIRKKIASGKMSFEEAAKKHSADKSNADRGGDLGFFEHKTMDPKFADAAFALTPKEKLSGVIQSSFGFHLIEYIDRQEGVSKSFDEVKKVLARRFLEEKNQRTFAQKVLADALKAGSLSSSSLGQLNTKWESKVEWSPLEDSIGALSVSNIDVNRLFALKNKGQFYPLVASQGQSLFLLKFVSKSSADVTSSELVANRASSSIQGYLDGNLKVLEEKQKIYRNDELMARMQQQLEQL